MKSTMTRWAMLLVAVAMLHINLVAVGQASPRIDVRILENGTGQEAVSHSKVLVHYTGWLMDGTKFDSSRDRGSPFSFTLGTGQVIAGWDRGIEGMKVGGKRELTIPPQLAYGERGAGGVIPPNATLKFEVELISVTPPKFSNVDNKALKDLLERGVKIVDLRREDEWKQTGVVEESKRLTAFNASGRFIQSFLPKLQEFAGPDEEVILICHTGARSSAIAGFLAEKIGYSKVYNVTGGIAEWLMAGNPVVK